jgi:hypothetical protein
LLSAGLPSELGSKRLLLLNLLFRLNLLGKQLVEVCLRLQVELLAHGTRRLATILDRDVDRLTVKDSVDNASIVLEVTVRVAAHVNVQFLDLLVSEQVHVLQTALLEVAEIYDAVSLRRWHLYNKKLLQCLRMCLTYPVCVQELDFNLLTVV